MPQHIGTIMTEHEPLITPTEINLHFAESYTLVEHGDEVAIVPRP